jgi:hypothetical protein
MNYLFLTLFFLLLTFFINKSETFETKSKKHYDIILSINVHEKFNFLLKQLDNISKNVHCNYAIILNCNDFMYEECKNNSLPDNVYIHPTILNKKTFHGSLAEGIYNNMVYTLDNFTFDFFIVTSSRNLFENDLHLEHLNKMVELDISDNIGKKWEDTKDEWHWPCVNNTLFVKYMSENNKLLYKSPHEGLCFRQEDCKILNHFLKEHSDMKNELFQCNCPAEEFALQTIVKSQNGNFYDIGNGCCSHERNPTNNPEKGIFKFMYKTNREEFNIRNSDSFYDL